MNEVSSTGVKRPAGEAPLPAGAYKIKAPPSGPAWASWGYVSFKTGPVICLVPTLPRFFCSFVLSL